jgi:hypothetical protein
MTVDRYPFQAPDRLSVVNRPVWTVLRAIPHVLTGRAL